MKRWALLVVLFYFLILVALTAPLALVTFYPQVKAADSLAAYFLPWYWAVLALLVGAQAVMLLVPVARASGRPTPRKAVLWPILAAGLMMALLVGGAGISIDEFIYERSAGTSWSYLPGAVLLLFWGLWTFAFYRISRGADAIDVVTRQCRYLLRGSILELLVAVPTHIVARVRDYCCAGMLTFMGIAFGISVMLFSFGPGVFFLFAARWKQLHPQPTPKAA